MLSLCYSGRTIYSYDIALAVLAHFEPFLKKKKKKERLPKVHQRLG